MPSLHADSDSKSTPAIPKPNNLHTEPMVDCYRTDQRYTCKNDECVRKASCQQLRAAWK